MSLNTGFQYTFSSQLPLPPSKEGTMHDVENHGIQTALTLLHDPTIMVIAGKKHKTFEPIHPTDDHAVDVPKLAADFHVSLNPADNTLDGLSEWKHFRITEDIPVVFGLTKTITFHSALRFNADGMEALTNPGSGVTIYGRWRVGRSESHPGCLQLSELADTRCNKVLGWYIKSTMQKAHDEVHAFLKEKFVERMRGQRWD